jgi:hypothetical protein
VSSFRLICIAALTTAMIALAAGSAASQSATVTDQSGKPYLAGLRPPHDYKQAQNKTAPVNTSHLSTHKSTIKSTRLATKRQPTVTAKSKTHRPVRLADKINSRVAWPSVEPTATDAPATSETVLQFAPEDTMSTPATSAPASAPAAAPRPTTPAPTASAAKADPPVNIAATEDRNSVASAIVDEPPPTANTRVQTERYQAAERSESPPVAPPREEKPNAGGHSATAQMLVTLAGAITAGIVGWLMIGFGSVGTIRSRQT